MATCRDIEGWKAVSRLRGFDSTPCFEEGVVISSILTLVLLSSVFKSFSLRLHAPLDKTCKSIWFLKAKLALLAISFITSLLNTAIHHKSVPVRESYFLETTAFASILIYTYFNHTRARRSSTVLLLFWPLYIGAIAIWCRTFTAANVHPNVALLILRLTAVGVGSVSYLLECVGSEIGLPLSDKLYKENPVLTANIYSIWTFSWMSRLMEKGASEIITQEDLPPLETPDESANLGEDLTRAMQKHTLWKALFVAYGGPYAVAAGFKTMHDLLAFLQPQLLRWLLTYISVYQEARFEPSDRPSNMEGFAIALIMFIASIVQTICVNQYFQRTFETGMRVRAGLVAVIYAKALVLSNDERSRATGDIVNLMSVDATRLQDFCTYGLTSFSGPFQIILAFISLYSLLGWSAFVGVAIMIVSIPLNAYIARVLKNLQEQQMKNRDKRSRLMSELLANIRSIKLYAWENTFIRRISEVRNNQELKMLRKIGFVTAGNLALWSGIPLLVAFSSFATAAVISSKPLTSDIIFPAIALFNLLGFPLAMFSQVISNIIEAVVSIKRLTSFLSADELQPDARKLIERPSLRIGDEVLSIKDADFAWSKTSVEPTLEGVTLSVKKGELVAVLGRVGAGKSSLLSAIIGEMTRREGEVMVYGTVAYAPQNPWILSATIRDNILFSHEYDETFYNLVIKGCALTQDLTLMPNGDLTEVGEKGITLSGGQRARIALARAVYARADLILLDDCLAAVDSHVARHIFDHVIGPEGLLSTKARILVTNGISFIKHFDSLVYVRRGIILERGSYQNLLANPNSEISKLVKGHQSSSGSSGTNTPFTSGTITPDSEPEEEILKLEDHASLLAEKLKHRNSFQKARRMTAQFQSQSVGLSKEHQEQGQVKTSVYKQYVQAASKFGFAVFLLAIITQQATSVSATITLRYWGEHNRETGNNEGMVKYLILYGSFALSSSLLGALSAIFMWVYCALQSATRLHDSMLNALMRAPLSYFEITPSGRILNLFSRDIYVVDQVLARIIHGLFRTLTASLSIVVVIGMTFPSFLFSVIPLAWFYLTVMRYYLATSRELKRLDAVTRSPIFAWFSESLTGLSTIRAFNQESIFLVANQKRVDSNQICYLPSISANRWLAVRLEFVGAFIIFIVASLAVSALITVGVDAGLTGLVLSFALSTTIYLNWVVRSASEVEQNIVSVERILHQIQVQSEAPYEISNVRPENSWPQSGAIEFQNYSTQYQSELDLVLKNISLQIQSGEKIGICGRTGAGKSSLLLALFRIIEPVSGSIYIDTIDITKIGLYNLRSALSIVPQSPDLFEGTIRENIDPAGEYSDFDIWIALDQVHLKTYIEALSDKLDTYVREGGSSLSAGQSQLLCFARALLRKAKILVLDEATSAIDLDTDKAIQDIIRGPAFKNTTILTIAHQLNTIIDYDRVIVLSGGVITECDTPVNLLNQNTSNFYSLAKEAGLL